MIAPTAEGSSYRIPFNRPSMAGNELVYIADVIARGHSAGDGAYTKKCHEFIERAMAVPRALLTTSCTHALEMAALLLDVGPGDEVIVPAFTFVSSVNAFVLRGATPVFIDIRPDTLNLDERQLEALITPRTKAIVVVHYAGVGCEMTDILEIAGRYGVPVIEDNAHGLFARYKGQMLGTFGCLATQSFHETKNVICGEGGALIVNEPHYIERAEILRAKGTDRSRFLRGQVDKYTWVDVGSSYPPSDILAAFLYAQLEKFEQIHARRMRIWKYYHAHLRDWAQARGIGLPQIPDYCDQSYHMFYLVMPSLHARHGVIEFLKARGILATFHYVPLHLSTMGARFGGQSGQCPITERVSDCLVRLPFYNELAREEQDQVIESLLLFESGTEKPSRDVPAPDQVVGLPGATHHPTRS